MAAERPVPAPPPSDPPVASVPPVGSVPPFASSLPVASVLPELVAALGEGHAVLVAEPGAGKTTLVPGALLEAPWLTGRVILLEPRRVVARAAARRLAAQLGERVGETVGTRMRMDTRVSARTRIEVVTEGVFTRAVLDDPELTGIGAVVFDEFHERSLDADLGLALALDVARSLRPDLRLLAMSATIDAAPLAALMDGARVVRSRGRAHPVALHHHPIGPREDVVRAVAARAVAAATGDGATRDGATRDGAAGDGAAGGSVLAFLPGRAEVERAVEVARTLAPGLDVLPLHGGLGARDQDRAVAPARGPRIVVATPIAESSLTIEGVDTVVDSGLVREPVHDAAVGVTRLETRRASRASVDQRAGRAGRTGPGRAIRLWAEAATAGLPPAAPPEIVRADLSGLLLDCLDWGAAPAALSWLDPPPAGALAAATRLLAALGAVEAVEATIRDGGGAAPAGRAIERPDAADASGDPDAPSDSDEGIASDEGSGAGGPGEAATGASSAMAAMPAITPLGRALRRLPLPPRPALALLAAPDHARGAVARLVLLLGERGLGGDGVDLAARERRWARERGERARATAALAGRWAEAATRVSRDLPPGTGPATHGALAALLLAHPDRVARARGPARADGRRGYLLASGRGAYLEASDPLASEEWIVALDMTGAAREQRVTSALAASRPEVEAALGHAVVEALRVEVEPGGRFRARTRRELGAIALDERRADPGAVPPDAIARAVIEVLRRDGLRRLAWGERSERLRARLAWLHARDPGAWPDVSDEGLMGTADAWLVPALAGASGLDALDDGALHGALTGLVPWERRADLDRLAPSRFLAPTGTRAPIAYPPDGGTPKLAIRVQEMFGVSEHPRAAGEPLLVELLSPARRPIQTTADLPGFWAGSWSEVRRDMRARYPRHPWPEDPAAAAPTTRAKPRGR